jgi:hypothetical protein
MFILSATASSTFFTSTPRVSLSFLSSSSPTSSSSSSRLCSVSVRFGARRPVFPCPIHSTKVRAMAEIVQDKDSAEKNVAFSGGERSHSRVFLDASTEEGSVSVFVVTFFVRKC